MEKFERIIRDFIKKETGIELMAANESLQVGKDVKLFSEIVIDPSDAGALKLMFKSIQMSIYAVVYQDGKCKFTVRYSYQHPSGSNGYGVDFVTDGDKVLTMKDYIDNECKF